MVCQVGRLSVDSIRPTMPTPNNNPQPIINAIKSPQVGLFNHLFKRIKFPICFSNCVFLRRLDILLISQEYHLRNAYTQLHDIH